MIVDRMTSTYVPAIRAINAPRAEVMCVRTRTCVQGGNLTNATESERLMVAQVNTPPIHAMVMKPTPAMSLQQTTVRWGLRIAVAPQATICVNLAPATNAQVMQLIPAQVDSRMVVAAREQK